MNQHALGLIETVGYCTAVSAADAALKAANVTLVGVERVIGVGGALGVTIQLSGDVGAVKSAVEAGKLEAEKVGRIISAHVIARSHSEVNDKLLPFFSLDKKEAEERVAAPTMEQIEDNNQVLEEISVPDSNSQPEDNHPTEDQSDNSNEEH